MTYLEKLKDPRWQIKRLEILERDENECRRCHTCEIRLEVHHLRYIKNHEPWEYENEDLITLCMFCHEIILPQTPWEDIYNPWLRYEREKKKLSLDLSPWEYSGRILNLSNKLSL